MIVALFRGRASTATPRAGRSVRRAKGWALPGAMLLAVATAGFRTPPRAGGNDLYFGEPLAGLSGEQHTAFDAGFQLFIHTWRPGEGLGPRYNATSCVACHRVPVPGGSGQDDNTRVIRGRDARADSIDATFQRFVLVRCGDSAVTSPLPMRRALRRSPHLFGLGLLESVSDSTLLSLADSEERDGSGLSGRVRSTPNGPGRFGWKASASTLDAFVAEAMATELGLSSERFPSNRDAHADCVPDRVVDVDEAQVREIAQYVRLLSPPRRGVRTRSSVHGERVFDRIGCAGCHRATLPIRPDARVPWPSHVVHPYTDLLVHDMGVALADSLPSLGAAASEFRTAPLWGLSSTGPPYLHDGRAPTTDAAIRWHGGEAALARERYLHLDERERRALLDFLFSL